VNDGNARELQITRPFDAQLQQRDPKLPLDNVNACIFNGEDAPESSSVPDAVSRTIQTVDEMFPAQTDHHAKEKSQWPIWIQIFQALLLISTNNIWHDIETSFTCLEGLETLLVGIKEANGELATHLLFSALKLDSPESLELTRFLLRSGVSPNSTHPKPSFSSRWWTALHEAVYRHSQESVRLLIEFGANPQPNSDMALYTHRLIMSPENLYGEYSIMHLPSLVDNGIRSDDYDPTHGVPPLFLALRNGALPCAQALLDAGADPNYWHPLLFTALHGAVSMANLGMVRLLIKAGALPNIRPLESLTTPLARAAKLQKVKTVFSPLQAAVQSKNLPIVEYLLNCGAKPDMDIEMDQCRNFEPYYAEPAESCLQMSASTRNYEMMRLLLRSHANPNFRHQDTSTVLQIVCGSTSSRERYHAALMLLRYGAEINALPARRAGRTALQAAVEVDDYRLTEFLLYQGADPNTPATQGGITAMEAAVKCGSRDLKCLLINNGNLEVTFDPEIDERIPRRYLELAVSAGNVTLLESIFMLGSGRNFSLSDEDANRVVKAAIVEGSLSLVQKLLTIYPQINRSWLLCESVWQGKSEIMEWILSWLPHHIVNLPPYIQPSPLWIALHQRNSYLVRRLLLAGADPNHTSYHVCRRELSSTSDYIEGMTSKVELPIEQAISPGHRQWEDRTEMVELLVSHGAQINCYIGAADSPSLLTTTPLIRALKEGKYKIADVLVRKGANPNAADETNKPAIIYASLAAQYCLVESLLEHGANANGSSDWGSPVQALACHRTESASDMQALIRTCRLLLDSGGDVNADPTKYCTMTALQGAIGHGTQELVEIFLEADANIHAPAFSYRGKTALQAAASTRNFKLVKRLVEMGADVNAPPAETGGATALQYAAICGYVNMAIFLLEHGASIKAPGSLKEGCTALQGASNNGRLDMIHLLLENDQDPDTVEERCRNSAGFAEEQGFTQIAEFLRGYKRQ